MLLRNLPRRNYNLRPVNGGTGSGTSTPRGLGGRSDTLDGITAITAGSGGAYFGDEEDDDGFKKKHRYLPIISGLAIPFAVLLDVS